VPSKPRSPRTPWRDNIEALTMAVIMALLLKCFIVEAYKIPTGSMQPTLIGHEEAGIFDRILVDKFSFAFRAPERWEVVVFRFPLDRSKNFVKRIAGIGPEQIRIFRGDVWHRPEGSEDSGEWRILRRPRSVQEEIWKRLDREEPEEPSWVVTDGGREWTVEGRTLRARGSGHARFQPERGAILDRYLDGYPEAVAEQMGRAPRRAANAVGDLRVDGAVTALPGTQLVTIDLDEGPRRYRFTLPGPAAPTDAVPTIREQQLRRTGEVERVSAHAAAPFRLPVGERVRFDVQNLDDLLELRIDGALICAVKIESTGDQNASASIGVAGEGADLEDLMVYRDIYYLASTMKESVVSIPEGSYYMLGDNTQDSSDSREWALARYRLVEEKGAEPVVIRGYQRHGENPLTIGIGDPGGPWVRLIDEWGEVRWLGADQRFERLSPLTSPLVPQEMILGRALAVFWPLNPRRDLYRLKWVH
jgi:signal peptidase I